MHKRKLTATLLAALLAFSLCGCGTKSTTSSKKDKKTKKTTTEETEESSSETEESSETENPTGTESSSSETDPSTFDFGPVSKDTIEDYLGTIDRLTSFECLSSGKSTELKYSLLFEMPLDWNDPDAGTFPLRATFTFVDGEASNTFCCDGYFLYDMDLQSSDTYRYSFADRYRTNYIQVEHRFYGKSVPDGLSVDSLDYWEYLTDENASEDFHYIISSFKKFLSGNWAFTGGSKGGQLTNMQSYFHPEDADVYISYVAPGGSSQDAPDFFDFIYTEIGNDAYGEVQAQIYRDLVLEVQVEAIKHRDEFAEKYYEEGINAGYCYTDYVTPDILFDMCVLDFATITWQYSQDFDSLQKAIDMRDNNDPGYSDYLYRLIFQTNTPDVWAHNSEYFAYYVQAAKQNGEHEYDFSFLRAALEADGSGAQLVVTEDMEEGLLFRMVFTPEQFEAFTFDDTVYKNMLEWSHTTDSLVIMIYGGADVWYSVRLPDVTDNDNVHIYTIPNASHMADFYMMSRDMREEIYGMLDPILNWY